MSGRSCKLFIFSCSTPRNFLIKNTPEFKPRLYSTSSNPKMAEVKFLFPGQGSQYVGMTAHFQPLCAGAEEVFTVASSVLGYDLKNLCINGPDNLLQDTIHCQPAVVVGSLVTLEQMKHKDPSVLSNCVVMAGFSVGEITALIASGAVPLDKGIELVKVRALSMQKACQESPSGMVTVIGLEEQTVNEICSQAVADKGGVASIANYIFPKGFVVSGSLMTLDAVNKMAGAYEGVSLKQIKVSGAFHSRLMSSAIPEMERLLDGIDFKLPSCPTIYSNVTGLPHPVTDVRRVRELLTQQIVEPVLWNQCIDHVIQNYGSGDFIEVGPGKQLKSMMNRISRNVFRNMANVEA